MPSSRHHLVLVLQPGRQGFDDFLEIAREIARCSPDIVVHILTWRDSASNVPRENWQYPTLTVSFGPIGRFLPRRGRIFTNRPIKKIDQYLRFRACGIPSPHTERFAFGKSYDEALFGRLSVLKVLPLGLTSKGQSVQLMRTARLASLRQNDFPPDHFLRQAPALIQQYIDCGERPAYYRVLTVFGEPVLWMKVLSLAPRGALDGTDEEIQRAVVDPRKKAEGQATYDFQDAISYDVPEDVMQFGRDMNRAFPDVPLQACDIVREEATGKLYAIEINAGGNTWDFSSLRVAKGIALLGGREAFIRRFDPFPRAARAIAAMVRQHAS